MFSVFLIIIRSIKGHVLIFEQTRMAQITVSTQTVMKKVSVAIFHPIYCPLVNGTQCCFQSTFTNTEGNMAQ